MAVFLSSNEAFSLESYNRLVDEKSPYLLQHKDNPIHWYPWGEEALEAAVRENKPIFLYWKKNPLKMKKSLRY